MTHNSAWLNMADNTVTINGDTVPCTITDGGQAGQVKLEHIAFEYDGIRYYARQTKNRTYLRIRAARLLTHVQ